MWPAFIGTISRSLGGSDHEIPYLHTSIFGLQKMACISETKDNFFLEGSIMSKLANGHFAMLNSSVALVEVPSIGTWKWAKIRILHRRISKTSKTGTGMCPPLIFKKEGGFCFYIIFPHRILCSFARNRPLQFWQLNFLNILRVISDYFLWWLKDIINFVVNKEA